MSVLLFLQVAASFPSRATTRAATDLYAGPATSSEKLRHSRRHTADAGGDQANTATSSDRSVDTCINVVAVDVVVT